MKVTNRVQILWFVFASFLVLVYLLALSVLGPESPAAAATAMTCDESSKRGAKLEEMNAAAGYILVHVFCRRSPKTL